MPKPGDDYYTTDGFSDYAAKIIEAQPKNKPFFFYVSYNAPHWPLQAKPADIAKYEGKFDAGGDVLREARYERMKKVGLLQPSWELSPHERDWAKAPNKAEMLRKMETYAAMVDSMDQGVGRIVDALKKSGRYDNTLLIFLSDNGACHEGASYGVPWANLSNTPFRMYKYWTHEGGMATPMIAHWPARIKASGQWRDQNSNIMDFMATFVDVSGANYPKTFKGHEITPMQGVSLLPAFYSKPLKRAAPLFWEHEGNRAVIEGDWKLVSASPRGTPPKWELYNLAQDQSEMNDQIKAQPALAQKMIAGWEAWTKKVGATTFQVSGKTMEQAPQIAGKSFIVTCDVTTDARNGVILAQGGAAEGYSLHLKNGALIFSVRRGGKLSTAVAPSAPVGRFKVEAQLQADGAMLLSINGKVAARGQADGVILSQPLDPFDIGRDTVAAVGEYKATNALVGAVENVKVTPQLGVPRD